MLLVACQCLPSSVLWMLDHSPYHQKNQNKQKKKTTDVNKYQCLLTKIWFKNCNFSSCFKHAENAFNFCRRMGENCIGEWNKGWHDDVVEFADGLLTTSKLRVRSRHRRKCRATCLSVVCWSSSAWASWQSADSHLFSHRPEGGSRRQTSKQAPGEPNKDKVILVLSWGVFTC